MLKLDSVRWNMWRVLLCVMVNQFAVKSCSSLSRSSRQPSLCLPRVTDSRHHVGLQQPVRRWFGLPVPGTGPQEDVGRGAAVWRQDVLLDPWRQARIHAVQHPVDQGRWCRRPHRSRRGAPHHIILIITSAKAEVMRSGRSGHSGSVQLHPKSYAWSYRSWSSLKVTSFLAVIRIDLHCYLEVTVAQRGYFGIKSTVAHKQ